MDYQNHPNITYCNIIGHLQSQREDKDSTADCHPKHGCHGGTDDCWNSTTYIALWSSPWKNILPCDFTGSNANATSERATINIFFNFLYYYFSRDSIFDGFNLPNECWGGALTSKLIANS